MVLGSLASPVAPLAAPSRGAAGAPGPAAPLRGAAVPSAAGPAALSHRRCLQLLARSGGPLPPLLGAPAAGAASGWRRWRRAGFVVSSWVRPVRVASPLVLGGVLFWVPSSPAAVAAGRPPFRCVAGSRSQRARSFRFSVVLPGCAPRLMWVVWAGAAGAPRRSSVLAWLCGVQGPFRGEARVS